MPETNKVCFKTMSIRFHIAHNARHAFEEYVRLHGLDPATGKDDEGTYIDVEIPTFWTRIRRKTFINAMKRGDQPPGQRKEKR